MMSAPPRSRRASGENQDLELDRNRDPARDQDGEHDGNQTTNHQPSTIIRRQARAIRILRCLQSGPAFNARELAARLQVSRRTVYRDLKLIREAGVAVLFDEEHAGYRLSASYPGDVAPPQVTAEDLALLMLTANFSPLQAMPQFRLASRESMSRLLGCYSRELRWPITRLLNCCEIAYPAPQFDQHQQANLLTICEAIRRRRLVEAQLTLGPRFEAARLAPYRLKLGAERWSTVARWTETDKVLEFDMDQLRELRLGDQAYLLPRGFNEELRTLPPTEPRQRRTAS